MIVIQCIDNTDALMMMIREAVAEVLKATGDSSSETNEVKQQWITTPSFKMHLKNKGYSATTSLTIKKISENHNIRTEKRGRDLWFYLPNVLLIPSKV